MVSNVSLVDTFINSPSQHAFLLLLLAVHSLVLVPSCGRCSEAGSWSCSQRAEGRTGGRIAIAVVDP